MANGEMTAEQARQLAAASNALIGRYQAPELFYSTTVDLATPNTLLIPRTLNLTRPLESITLRLRFRVSVTVANYAAVAPEAPQNIIQQIQLQGIHRAFGNITTQRISGAMAYAWTFINGIEASQDILVDNASQANTRAADPNRPLTSPFAGTTAASPYDIEMIINIPLGPVFGLGKGVKRDLASFLYLPEDWSDSLQFQVTFGDKSALGDPTGAIVAFAGYGGTGDELLEVYLNHAILGQLANALRTGVCIRTEQTLTGFTALATDTRLTTLQKNITTAIVVRSGVLETTGQTAGVTTLESVSDTLLDRTQIRVDNKPVRNNQSNAVYKSYYQRQFGAIIPEGYFLMSFLESQNSQLAYRGDGLAGGTTFELTSDIESASANNRLFYVQEMILGGPFASLR